MLASCHHNMHLVYNQCYGNRAYKSVYQNGAFIKIANWAFVKNKECIAARGRNPKYFE